MMADPLARFVQAQAGGVYERALGELRAGRKRTHWMWFVFPQLEALGRSATARLYGLSGRAEAEAYLAHPLLGPRLLACVDATLALDPAPSARALFGSPDDLKYRSCLTLFGEACDYAVPGFDAALERFYGGEGDPLTLRLLADS